MLQELRCTDPNIAGNGLPSPASGRSSEGKCSLGGFLAWLAREIVCAGSPGQGTPLGFISALTINFNNYSCPETSLGAVRNKATKADNHVQKWFIFSASPQEVTQLLRGLPPSPKLQRKKSLDEIEAEIKPHAHVQEGKRATGAKYRSFQS